MDQNYWLESFTRRHFLWEHESLPTDAVQLVKQQMLEIHNDATKWMRRLHAQRWHKGCSYPLLQMSQTCEACRTIIDLEHFLKAEVFIHIPGVVIDFFHEPDHKDQLEEAMKLYASSSFHQCKHEELVRWRNELLDYSKHQVERLSHESSSHKVVQEQTTSEDLKKLALTFAKTYSELVRAFDTWRRENPGVIISAFPTV